MLHSHCFAVARPVCHALDTVRFDVFDLFDVPGATQMFKV